MFHWGYSSKSRAPIVSYLQAQRYSHSVTMWWGVSSLKGSLHKLQVTPQEEVKCHEIPWTSPYHSENILESPEVKKFTKTWWKRRNVESLSLHKNIWEITSVMYTFFERRDQELSTTVSIMFTRHFWTILQYPEVFAVFSEIEYIRLI